MNKVVNGPWRLTRSGKISLPPQQLLASKARLCSVELITSITLPVVLCSLEVLRLSLRKDKELKNG